MIAAATISSSRFSASDKRRSKSAIRLSRSAIVPDVPRLATLSVWPVRDRSAVGTSGTTVHEGYALLTGAENFHRLVDSLGVCVEPQNHRVPKRQFQIVDRALQGSASRFPELRHSSLDEAIGGFCECLTPKRTTDSEDSAAGRQGGGVLNFGFGGNTGKCGRTRLWPVSVDLVCEQRPLTVAERINTRGVAQAGVGSAWPALLSLSVHLHEAA